MSDPKTPTVQTTAIFRQWLAGMDKDDLGTFRQMLWMQTHLLCDAVDRLTALEERGRPGPAPTEKPPRGGAGGNTWADHTHTWQRYPDHMQSTYGPTHVCTVCGAQRTALPGEVP